MVSENGIPRLIAYGKDGGLLNTRRLILELGNLHLDTVTNMTDLSARLYSGLPYRLIILCHTVPDSERPSAKSLAVKAHTPIYQLQELTRPEVFRENVLRLLEREGQDCFHHEPESVPTQGSNKI